MFHSFRVLLAFILAAGLAGLTPSIAAAHKAAQGEAVDASAVALGPGGYSWAPQRAPQGPVKIVVSLAEQRAYVYRGGVRIGVSEASTGKEGNETPTGVFTILEKDQFHRSNRYNDAPMPYMQRLTWNGVALHGGPLPGYAASHGCIRLPFAFAKKLFGVTSVGTQVVVTDGDAASADMSSASVQPPPSADDEAPTNPDDTGSPPPQETPDVP